MAFTTIPGGDLADIILLGSEAADTVVLNTSESIIANGFGGDDSITIANPVVATGGNKSTFTSPSTIYGGEGNDSFLLADLTVGSSQILGGVGNDFFGTGAAASGIDYQAAEVNGNEGEDTFGAKARGIQATGSQILGGANNDTIYVGASTNTEFNGNKNLDRLYVVGDQIGGSVFGGKGIDFIDTAYTANTTYTGTSISGADGNDVISNTFATVVADNSTLTVLGGQGTDNITLTLSKDGAGVGEGAFIAGGSEADFITITAGANAITASRLTVNGGDGDDTITAFGNVNGGAGADSIDINGGVSTLLYAMSEITTETGLTTATIDSVTGFASGTDTIKTGIAGSLSNFENSGPAGAQTGFSAALNAANVFFTTAGKENFQYYVVDDLTAGVGAYLFFKNSTSSATATAAILINDETLAFGDIVA